LQIQKHYDYTSNEFGEKSIRTNTRKSETNDEILDESSSNYHTRKDQGRRSLGAAENVLLQKIVSGSGKNTKINNPVTKELAVKELKVSPNYNRK
jgi:hypothetical protein